MEPSVIITPSAAVRGRWFDRNIPVYDEGARDAWKYSVAASYPVGPRNVAGFHARACETMEALAERIAVPYFLDDESDSESGGPWPEIRPSHNLLAGWQSAPDEVMSTHERSRLAELRRLASFRHWSALQDSCAHALMSSRVDGLTYDLRVYPPCIENMEAGYMAKNHEFEDTDWAWLDGVHGPGYGEPGDDYEYAYELVSAAMAGKVHFTLSHVAYCCDEDPLVRAVCDEVADVTGLVSPFWEDGPGIADLLLSELQPAGYYVFWYELVQHVSRYWDGAEFAASQYRETEDGERVLSALNIPPVQSHEKAMPMSRRLALDQLFACEAALAFMGASYAGFPVRFHIPHRKHMVTRTYTVYPDGEYDLDESDSDELLDLPDIVYYRDLENLGNDAEMPQTAVLTVEGCFNISKRALYEAYPEGGYPFGLNVGHPDFCSIRGVMSTPPEDHDLVVRVEVYRGELQVTDPFAGDVLRDPSECQNVRWTGDARFTDAIKPWLPIDEDGYLDVSSFDPEGLVYALDSAVQAGYFNDAFTPAHYRFRSSMVMPVEDASVGVSCDGRWPAKRVLDAGYARFLRGVVPTALCVCAPLKYLSEVECEWQARYPDRFESSSRVDWGRYPVVWPWEGPDAARVVVKDRAATASARRQVLCDAVDDVLDYLEDFVPRNLFNLPVEGCREAVESEISMGLVGNISMIPFYVNLHYRLGRSERIASGAWDFWLSVHPDDDGKWLPYKITDPDTGCVYVQSSCLEFCG